MDKNKEYADKLQYLVQQINNKTNNAYDENYISEISTILKPPRRIALESEIKRNLSRVK